MFTFFLQFIIKIIFARLFKQMSVFISGLNSFHVTTRQMQHKLPLVYLNFWIYVIFSNMTSVFYFVIFMMLKLSVGTFENSSKENAIVSTQIFKTLHSKTFL